MAIRRITIALHATTNMEQLVRQALDTSIETVDAQGGTIYLHNPEKKVLIFKYVVGATPEITRHLTNMEMADDKGIAGEVFHSGKSRITLKVAEEKDHNTDLDKQTKFHTESMVSIPLRSMTGTTIGVMQVLNRRESIFDEEDQEVLEILGAQAASAIETARLYEEARRASVINLIGDISHDVKNLLTPVVTGTQTLELDIDAMFEQLDREVPLLPQESQEGIQRAVKGVRGFYKEAMEMVYEGAQDAQERVREIADAIKGIISQPHFEESDLRERVEAVAKVLKIVAERKGVAIDIEGVPEPTPMELDRKGIYNALYNLINNAIPETPEGGVISVRSHPIEVDSKPWIEILVADTGKGMPAHVRESMFTPHAVSTKIGGTGLGTRIVKNVVDSHHGTIRVDSETGKGTTFTIRIPRHQPRAEPAAA